MWGKLIALGLIATFTVVSAADKKVVCYYGSWSVYRPGNGKFTVENIDPTLCTHLIYSFVGISSDGGIRILDPYNEIDQRGFARFNALKQKNPKLKTLVAVGGWNEGSITFSQVASSQFLRSAFINNAINFVKQYGFDGFDLDWEYPGQRGGSPLDKVNLGLLVKEFRAAFDKHGLLITAAVGATAKAINLSYDVPALSQHLHFINIMAYDLHGAYDGVTGENAPLYASSVDVTEEAKQLNVEACVKAWIANGAAPEKLVLGIGVYGRCFTLDNAFNTAIGAPASRPGNPGPYTREAGMLGYNEICESQLTGQWTVVWNDQQKVPYAYQGNQWVGYDNPQSVGLKAEFAKKMKLGGLMIWSIETDDFLGRCGRKYPILSAVNSGIKQ